MAEWIYFIHPPRDDFAATMTDEEKRVWALHFERLRRLFADGVIVLVGPTLGSVNTGIAIFEAPDMAAARQIMNEDPVIAGGYARGELRPLRISLLRGRDEGSSRDSEAQDEGEVRSLSDDLLACWNRRQAGDFAALFTPDGNCIGFDGSQMNGQPEIEASLGRVFADHPTAAYVGKIREVRFLTPEVAVLRAVAGMVPPGQSDLNPAVNAVQTLIATKRDGRWRIAVFQNTPAALHGRADLREQMTEELRQVFRRGGTA